MLEMDSSSIGHSWNNLKLILGVREKQSIECYSGGCNGKTRKQLLDDLQRSSSTTESMKPSAVYNLESYQSILFYTLLPPAQALQVISIFRSGVRCLRFPIDCATVPPLES